MAVASYRIYFLCGDGRIIGREDFVADDDVAAIRLGRTLCDACSDICSGLELWQGQRKLRVRPPPYRPTRVAALNEFHQAQLISTEESISRSQWRIAHSQRLLELLASTHALRSK
jgi:hypothetical protein